MQIFLGFPLYETKNFPLLLHFYGECVILLAKGEKL